jgi:adenylosuccinate synthase
MKVSVVIGANYGDEGKGLITDYLASQSESLVVRFNGGAQAGHTVVTPEGKRHVFHQFGSGTFTGAPTFLSNHFVVNPMTYVKELEALKEHGLDPIVYIDPRAYVTTPYDMMLNQAVEKYRANQRHGSCGLGFNETIERNENSSFGFKIEDLFHSDIVSLIEEMRRVWIPERAKQLDLSVTAFEEITPMLNDKGIFEHFVQDLMQLTSTAKVCYLEEINWDHDYLFEGAQGLMLDEKHPNFPYVTRSATGRQNALEILKEADISVMPDFYYVSRSYLTRHGAGPLPHELSNPIATDQTNVDNVFQGNLRYAYLDTHDLIHRIRADIGIPLPRESNYFVMTCVDHFHSGVIPHYDCGRLTECNYGVLTAYIEMQCGANDYFTVHGPTRNDIQQP